MTATTEGSAEPVMRATSSTVSAATAKASAMMPVAVVVAVRPTMSALVLTSLPAVGKDQCRWSLSWISDLEHGKRLSLLSFTSLTQIIIFAHSTFEAGSLNRTNATLITSDSSVHNAVEINSVTSNLDLKSQVVVHAQLHANSFIQFLTT